MAETMKTGALWAIAVWTSIIVMTSVRQAEIAADESTAQEVVKCVCE